jgi:hypothetical protein
MNLTLIRERQAGIVLHLAGLLENVVSALEGQLAFALAAAFEKDSLPAAHVGVRGGVWVCVPRDKGVWKVGERVKCLTCAVDCANKGCLNMSPCG